MGFLDDTDKFDAIAAADLLIMPSYFESLSMVALEAWALGRPVLANGKCDVLKGQCIRSNAGLYYETYSEFVETLQAIERNRWLSAALGRNGRQFFREHYDWSIIERKYLDMFARLSQEAAGKPLDPLPGWSERRRQNLPPAEEVVGGLPKGPWLGDYRADRAGTDSAPPSWAAAESAPRFGTPDRKHERSPGSGSPQVSNRRGYGRAYRRGGPQR